MRFHLITYSGKAGAKSPVMRDIFEKACEKLGVELVVHNASTFNLADLPTLGHGDMLYRAATAKDAGRAEKIMTNADCASFYTNWSSVFSSRGCSYYLHEKTGIPVIPTVPFIPEGDEALTKAVESLGNFPIIVKILGGSHGVGVVRIDSMPSLRSLLDYLRAQGSNILLRKYIEHPYYSRLVVVGDKVVASHVTYAYEDEFRTNAGQDDLRTREARVFPQAIQDMAVRAVHLLGLETGGVDLLFDKNDQPFLAEVNFPNDFTTTQAITGIDIAEAMVAHLVSKVDKATPPADFDVVDEVTEA